MLMYVCWRHAVLSIYVGRRISCYLRSRPACSDSGSGPARRVGRGRLGARRTVHAFNCRVVPYELRHSNFDIFLVGAFFYCAR